LLTSQAQVTNGSYDSFRGQADASAWTVAVPEPVTLALVAFGLAAPMLRRRRK
jgi:hypothetical protein